MNKDIPYTAPAFSLQGNDGHEHSLFDYRGQWVVLYFYPKDDTPGCTVEACSFRDFSQGLLAQKAVVIGVSRDTIKSHQSFIGKHSLNFILLSDPEHAVMDAYGAWGKKMFGQEGVLRKTFIVNPDGQVVKVYGKVTPLGHAEQVIGDLKLLQQ